MKVRITIPKIQCKRTTREFFEGKDEIYYAISTIATKIEGGNIEMSTQSPIYGIVATESHQMNRKSTHNIWVPVMHNNVITIDDDAQSLGVNIGLYEKDDGNVFDQMKQHFNGLIEPHQIGLDWGQILNDIKDLVLRDVNNLQDVTFTELSLAIAAIPELSAFAIGKFLYKIGKIVYNTLKSDDFIDHHNFNVDLTDTHYNLDREYLFKGDGAEYIVSCRVNKVE